MIPFLIIFILLILVLSSCIKIVPQGNAYVIERLGKYNATWSAGLHFKIPLIDKIVRKISLKEQVADFEPTNTICSDNVTYQKIYSV